VTKPTSLQNTVKQHRQAAKLTQEQLAGQLGVTRQTLLAIENGKYSPNLEMARILGCTIDELFSLPEE
jgi:putative transcriptional regulator